jgi:two-component system chemotaxis sensor kinase CheA
VFRSLKFRYRIGLLVAVAGIALLLTTAVTLVLGRQGERELTAIETRYVPLLELDRELEELFRSIHRTLLDASDAAEESGIVKAAANAELLVKRLEANAERIANNGGNTATLVAQFRAYFATAHEVTAKLVNNTPAEQLTDQIERMGTSHDEFASKLSAATTPDRRRLGAAFAEARKSQRTALLIDIVVAICALSLMALYSWTIIRQTVKSLQAVSLGMERLAEGELGPDIDIRTDDELGDLAREANATARRLYDYRERTEALLEQTQRQTEELARASRYKSEFLANMSHELRTPLNSIMILSKVLGENENRELTARQVEFANLIHRSGEELLTLINDVLDLAKIEAGKQTLVCEPVKLGELTDYVRRMFEPHAHQKKLELLTESAPDLPAEIRTDRIRVHQILKNLLSNAVKFTERGRVEVAFSRAGADEIEIAVSDTGIGIPADKLDWIFEAFAQAEGGTSRKYGGTGLGLSIVKELAERLGGSIRVESVLEQGSTFRLVLPISGPPMESSFEDSPRSMTPPPMPLAISGTVSGARERPSRPAVTAEMPSIIEPSLDGKTVLIVDDDMRNVYSLAGALRAKHLRVLTASDGLEALDELARHPETDAVLIDVMMPRMDGHEATRKIREMPQFADLPIIALTAKTMPGEREKCLEAGANEYVPKPVDVAQLIQLLRVWLD